MKSFSRIGCLCLIACSLTVLVTNYPAVAQSAPDYDEQQYGDTPPDIGEPVADVAPEDFEDELATHGRWIDTPEYGRVWVPDVEENFQPYATNGHWVVTEYGNTWVSDYSWGWAPFHYGRWYRDSRWGWTWVPGRVWGPAWVAWRSGGGYYGWAPLGPNVSINVNIPLYSWIYVPQEYVTSYQVNNYYIYGSRADDIHRRSNYIRSNYRVHNRTYVYGPRRQELERVTRRRVDVYRVRDRNEPGRSTVDGGNISIYRRPGSSGQPRRERSASGDNPRRDDRQPERRRGSSRPDANPNPGERPAERPRRGSSRPDSPPVNPSDPGNPNPGENERPPERRRRGSSRPDSPPVNPGNPNPGGNERPQERPRRGSSRPDSPPVNPGNPNPGGERQQERPRRGSSRPDNPPPSAGSPPPERPRSSRPESPPPSGSTPPSEGGRHGGRHDRGGRGR